MLIEKRSFYIASDGNVSACGLEALNDIQHALSIRMSPQDSCETVTEPLQEFILRMGKLYFLTDTFMTYINTNKDYLIL